MKTSNSHRFEADRRAFLRWSSSGCLAAGAQGWLPRLAAALEAQPERRHCILLWMVGGPNQTDTFDMKPDHTNGGEFRERATSVPGLRFSEHLPQLAEQADQLAVVRSVSTKEGDHSRATYLTRTGRPQSGDVRYPAVGHSLAKELGNVANELPDYVSVLPQRALNPSAFSPGFLGPKYAAATVAARESEGDFADLGLDNLQLATEVDWERAERRLQLWDDAQREFLSRRPGPGPRAHDTLLRRATRLMRSEAVEAFDLSQEPNVVREAYGRSRFGQGCLMARRLIERGVALVEVALGDGLAWDTHQDNFNTVERLSAELDAGWSTLMRELADRRLLETTTLLWMGEFGRTPQINGNAGRDHFPQAWSCVLAGGGIAGGQAYGRTSHDGTEVEEGAVGAEDILATLCAALGIDPEHENLSNDGRPHKISEGRPLLEILT